MSNISHTQIVTTSKPWAAVLISIAVFELWNRRKHDLSELLTPHTVTQTLLPPLWMWSIVILTLCYWTWNFDIHKLKTLFGCVSRPYNTLDKGGQGWTRVDRGGQGQPGGTRVPTGYSCPPLSPLVHPCPPPSNSLSRSISNWIGVEMQRRYVFASCSPST